MERNYDFSGWATRNDLKCSDGRTIRKDAFAHNDGQWVPLVWNHLHNDPDNVLGKALLKNHPEGVRAYGYFNETSKGQNAKSLVVHGDIGYLSIYANHLKQNGGDVLHGDIREVSLVLAGANPGAYIDDVIEHGDHCDDEAIFYTDEEISLIHSDEDEDKEEIVEEAEEEAEEETAKEEELSEESSESSESDEMEHADKEEEESMADKEKTVQEVFDTLNEEQKTVVYAIVGQAVEDALAEAEGGEEEEEEGMKHNVFDKDEEMRGDVLMHADQEEILRMAKTSNIGSFKAALEMYANDNGIELQHDGIAPAGGFVQPPTAGNVSMLFPEYAEVRPGAPELITNDQTWVSAVIDGVHKSPISRIRTSHVDIRGIDELRAKGYVKGKEKALAGNFALARRTTDPQTIYVKNALHRDDIVDITDFDYVDYLYKIDMMMLKEELATAILIGDGRSEEAEDKISEDHIRPIWTDDDLYTIHAKLDYDAAEEELQGEDTSKHFGENYIWAEAMVNACLYARENYKGTGSPIMFIAPHMLNMMLLARDFNGRRIYSGVSELATALNVSKIVTVEQFADKTRTVTEDGSEVTKKLIAMIVNLNDYNLGATKGGQITHFTDFDIDFNQQKSLIETRCSGALTRVYSAIAIEQDVTP